MRSRRQLSSSLYSVARLSTSLGQSSDRQSRDANSSELICHSAVDLPYMTLNVDHLLAFTVIFINILTPYVSGLRQLQVYLLWPPFDTSTPDFHIDCDFFGDLKVISINFCIMYSESPPYFYSRLVWPTDLVNLSHASTLTSIIPNTFEVDMTTHCRVTAFLLPMRYMTCWPWPFDLVELSHMAGHVTNFTTKLEDHMFMRTWVMSYNVFHWIGHH